MNIPAPRWSILSLATVAGLGVLALPACDDVGSVLSGVKPPTASLQRVDLLQAPTVNQLLGWSCYEYGFGDAACTAVGFDSKPKKNKMQFSFDLVFDLANPNDKLPIPLVEILLGFTALEENNLGAACITFCDPDEEACTPDTNAEEACNVDEADDVTGPEDLVPTVDELVGIGEELASGDLSNWSFRTIEPNSSMEAHIAFDVGIDPMMGIFEDLLGIAVEDFIAGDPVELVIPYTVEGTLFFDVPEMGRKALGFGPFADEWQVE